MSKPESGGSAEPREPLQHRVKEKKPLPSRFYRTVSVGERGGLHAVLLDGRPAKTPGKAPLAVANAKLAEALAAEWRAQDRLIDPATMPLTRLVNTAIDHVPARLAEVRADIARYAESDLVCYRAEAPRDLSIRQASAWDPVLAWAEASLGARLTTAKGIMPVTQDEAAFAAVANALEPYDALEVAALHVMTTLLGSVLLALAQVRGLLTADAAWAAAHVDEDWQIEQWGGDDEAKVRRALRFTEFASASHLLTMRKSHCGGHGQL